MLDMSQNTHLEFWDPEALSELAATVCWLDFRRAPASKYHCML
jgi:hypothetical protein